MQLKTFFIGIGLACLTTTAFAQDRDRTNTPEPEEKFFKLENLFTGGNVSAGFGGGTTISQFSAGVIPHFGYKFFNWLDAGISFNVNYSQFKDKRFSPAYKENQTTFGPGVFTRIYPVNFIFAQAQFEHNFTTVKYKNGNVPDGKYNADASSFLLGAGYAQGRESGNNTFFYLSLSVDVLKNINSPYVNVVYNSITGTYEARMAPVFRAGVNVALFQNRYGKY